MAISIFLFLATTGVLVAALVVTFRARHTLTGGQSWAQIASCGLLAISIAIGLFDSRAVWSDARKLLLGLAIANLTACGALAAWWLRWLRRRGGEADENGSPASSS